MIKNKLNGDVSNNGPILLLQRKRTPRITRAHLIVTLSPTSPTQLVH